MHATSLTRRTFLNVAAGMTAAASLAACGSNQAETSEAEPEEAAEGSAAEEAPAETAAETTVIPFGALAPNAAYTGIYVAIEKGWYAEEGIELDLLIPEDDGMANIATGVTPIGLGWQDYEAGALGAANPLPLTAIAAIQDHTDTGWLVKPEIESPKDLEGKRWATWELPIELAQVQTMVEADGGDFSKVEVVPLEMWDLPAGLQADMFDAVWGWEYTDYNQCQLQGIDCNFIRTADIEPVLDIYTPLILANSDWIVENADLTRAFLRATKKGYEFARDNVEEATEILIQYAPELDPELAKVEQEAESAFYTSDGGEWGLFDADRWAAFFEWLNERELTETPLDPAAGFTNEYLPEA